MPKPKPSKLQLVKAALRGRAQAVAPYSQFQVGAALLTRAGEIITGANVESASYGLTCCAERVALFKALTEGERNFVAIAVVARLDGGVMPLRGVPAIAGGVCAGRGRVGCRRGEASGDSRIHRQGFAAGGVSGIFRLVNCFSETSPSLHWLAFVR